MKSFLPHLALVVVVTADAPAQRERTLSFAHDILAELSAALEHPSKPKRLDGVDWMSAAACAADLTTFTVVDKTGCATAKDSDGGACVWCDATALIGTGVCVGGDVQAFSGQMWGQVCGAEKVAASPAVTLASARAVFAPAVERVGEGDWMADLEEALACTANSDATATVDEAACPTANDGKCTWCDASAVMGQGVCVSATLKSMVGQFWDAVCAGADGTPDTPTTPDAVPATPDSTPAAPAGGSTQNLPTPPPAASSPTPAVPTPDNGVPDIVRCSLDASTMKVVSDETTCLGLKDAQEQACAWCGVKLLGTGACITSDTKTAMSFLCSAAAAKEATLPQEGKYLRGINEEADLEDHL